MAACLRKYGVRTIYGIAGEAVPDFMISLLEQTGPHPIQFITTRHEQGAAFMAYGNAMVSLREAQGPNERIVPGICLSTQGAGALNLITGIAAAKLDQVPLIAITGQIAQRASFKHGFQRIDVVGAMQPITKWAVTIVDPENLAEIVAQAFRLALTPPYGPVHIEFPVDIGSSFASFNTAPLDINYQPMFSLPDPRSIAHAFELIERESKPLFVVGPEIFTRISGENIAYRVLRELVAHTNIPVLTTPGGKGALLSNDIHSVFSTAFPPRDWPDEIVKWASVVIYVGFNRGEVDPAEKWKKFGIPAVHINNYPAIVEVGYHPTVEVLGDIGTALAGLFQLFKKSNKSWDYDPHITYIREKFASTLTYEGHELRDAVFQGIAVIEIAKYMQQFGNDATIVLDSGFHQLWMRRNMEVDSPFSIVSSDILSPIGCGLPTSLGVVRGNAICNKARKVLLVSGDGGFGINMGEMATIEKLKLNGTDPELTLKLVVLVWNDSTHAIVEWNQVRLLEKHYDLSVVNPNFEKLGNAIPGWRGLPEITDKSQIAPRLAEAFADPSPGVLLSIRIDPSQNKHFTDCLHAQLPEETVVITPYNRPERVITACTRNTLFGGPFN